MSKYSWPLPGEGAVSQDLAIKEIRQAIPGLASYSYDASIAAIVAEIVAALYNGFPITITPASLTRIATTPVLLVSAGGSSVTCDLSLGTYFSISVNSPGGYSIPAALNPYPSNTISQFAVIEIHNSSGGAITTSWDSSWHLAGGSWSDPGVGKSRFITFLQLNSVFQEISRSVADT